MDRPVYKRILLKLSGEALSGNSPHHIDLEVLKLIADELKEIIDLNVQIGIVVGGGNIFRGQAEYARSIDRTSADYMGMLATVINSLALQNVLEGFGIQTRILSAIEMREIAEIVHPPKGVASFRKGAGGYIRGGNRQSLFHN